MSLQWTPGAYLPNTATLAYKVPDGKVANKLNFWFTNPSAAAREVTVHIVPDGGSVDNANRILSLDTDSLKIEPDKEQPIELRQVLRPGDEVHWFSDTASALAGTLSAQEIDESTNVGEEDHGIIYLPKVLGISPQTFGIQTRTYARSDIGYAAESPSFTTLRTVPAGKQMLGFTLLLHNTHTDWIEEAVYAIPSGGSDDDRYRIGAHHEGIAASHTRERYYPLYLPAGAAIKVNSDVASKLVCSLSAEYIEV